MFLSTDSHRVCFDHGVHLILDPQSMAFHLVDSNMIEVIVQVHVCANQNCSSCIQRLVAQNNASPKFCKTVHVDLNMMMVWKKIIFKSLQC